MRDLVHLEAATSVENTPPLDWPLGKFMGKCLDEWLNVGGLSPLLAATLARWSEPESKPITSIPLLSLHGPVFRFFLGFP